MEAALWQYFVIPLIHLQLSFIKRAKMIVTFFVLIYYIVKF